MLADVLVLMWGFADQSRLKAFMRHDSGLYYPSFNSQGFDVFIILYPHSKDIHQQKYQE